jgi:hypothetical protein
MSNKCNDYYICATHLPIRKPILSSSYDSISYDDKSNSNSSHSLTFYSRDSSNSSHFRDSSNSSHSKNSSNSSHSRDSSNSSHSRDSSNSSHSRDSSNSSHSKNSSNSLYSKNSSIEFKYKKDIVKNINLKFIVGKNGGELRIAPKNCDKYYQHYSLKTKLHYLSPICILALGQDNLNKETLKITNNIINKLKNHNYINRDNYDICTLLDIYTNNKKKNNAQPTIILSWLDKKNSNHQLHYEYYLFNGIEVDNDIVKIHVKQPLSSNNSNNKTRIENFSLNIHSEIKY